MLKAEFLINYKGEPLSLDTILSVFDIYQLKADNPADDCCILYPIHEKANPGSPIFMVYKENINAVLNKEDSLSYKKLQNLISKPTDKSKIKKIAIDQMSSDIRTTLFDFFNAIL